MLFHNHFSCSVSAIIVYNVNEIHSVLEILNININNVIICFY